MVQFLHLPLPFEKCAGGIVTKSQFQLGSSMSLFGGCIVREDRRRGISCDEGDDV